ncbi:helix-turn-helix transcriptional regulator [Phytomonospora sp. NPDC050363]|uniref:helix-turn-helix transcriptional regulator n=1 Tax=Phytomonospora sp. NPDC050363 TaxID=3155642 RepID=UPI0033F67E7E
MSDLSGFLRTRRARVDPADAGIPADSRRRVDGLRREEVAHLSGVSVDYYVRLEQGRALRPSGQVLDALARVLRLDDAERAHLHRLAHPPRRDASPPSTLRPELHRVLDAFTATPAMIVDHRLDVLAANRLASLLYDRPAPGYNTARHIFLEADGRDLYGDWEKCTGDVVGHLRHSAGRFPQDGPLKDLITELSEGSSRFRDLWSRADVAERTHGRKAFRHPVAGELDLHQENFAMPRAPGQELVVLTAPEGSAAEAGLRLLDELDEDSGHSVSAIAYGGKFSRRG